MSLDCSILSIPVCDPLPFASARVRVCAYGQYANYVRRQTALIWNSQQLQQGQSYLLFPACLIELQIPIF